MTKKMLPLSVQINGERVNLGEAEVVTKDNGDTFVVAHFDEKYNAFLLISQAATYGERVRLAEDSGDKEERKIQRREWMAFLAQHRNGPNKWDILRSYSNAYSG